VNGPEHYREAEKHIDAAQTWATGDPDAERVHLAYAQVHATLALAAAQAAQRTVTTYPGGSVTLTEWGDRRVPTPGEEVTGGATA
jgi:hypothetical protein